MTVINANCLDWMRIQPDNSIDCIITDPPYALTGKSGKGGFMGKEWDSKLPSIEIWQEALRISKPGSWLLAFGGSRTYHRLTCSIEDAGFEIKDSIVYLYGSGFPKSHNFGCKCKGKPLPYNHDKTTKSNTESSLRLMQEANLSQEINPIEEQRKVLFEGLSEQNLQKYKEETGNGIEIRQESFMERRSNLQEEQGKLPRTEICKMSEGISGDGAEGRLCNGTSSCNGETFESNTSEGRGCTPQRPQHSEQCNRESGAFPRQSDSQNRRGETCPNCQGIIGFEGWGTALKPSYEPIIMAMKPLDGTYKNNAKKWNVAGINIEESRLDSKRWPANIILDEVAAELLDQQTGISKSSGHIRHNSMKNNIYESGHHGIPLHGVEDSGGASRFFYCAKASSSERNRGCDNIEKKDQTTYSEMKGNEDHTPNRHSKVGNNHPCVKPLKLMEYLIKLVAPKDGVILDPFCGSGSTLVAAKKLGFKAIGIELDPEYCKIAEARIASQECQMELEL